MKNYNVLIVDDEKNVSQLLEKILIKEGFNTFTANNGSMALSIIDGHHVDMVITDIRMPNMSGIELLERIRKTDPLIKVILITAFATLETALKALRMGAQDYITKPFDLDEVLLAIHKIVGSSVENDIDHDVFQEAGNSIENYLVTVSPEMSKVMELIKQVSDSKSTIILYGETGTGKELVAQALHKLSERKDNPFIKVNCAAIPDLLLESELFGYEKGAFTGATSQKPGRFELANGGSIFLDEIGDISLSMQAKLLRVLQQKEYERLGGIKTIKTDVRIIAATNKDLEDLVEKGSFREDLFYRLNVVPIYLPPLRRRKEDIPILVKHFLVRSSYISGKPRKEITVEVMEKLINYHWPGNIRELENIIERCVVVTPGNLISLQDLPSKILESSRSQEPESYSSMKLDDTVDQVEKEVIMKTLNENGGNRTKTAERLGISRRSLHRKLNKYHLEHL